jgi:dihydroorotase
MKQQRPLTITGGRLVLAEGLKPGALRCAGGRIAALGDVRPEDGDEVVDARGALVAPGLVDFGVFAIDKPAFHFGGITRAGLMPDRSPPLDRPSAVRFAAQSGKPDLWVHPLAAATVGLEGTHLAELALMREAGAKAVATGRKWIADSGAMLRLLQYAAMLDLVVVSHAEDGGLSGGAAASAGEMASRLGLSSAPSEAEALAVARDIALAELAGARLHLRQVTTRAALGLVRAAKARGVAVTAGVTPAHFMLSDLAMGEFRTFARLSPPLREEADRRAVVEAIGTAGKWRRDQCGSTERVLNNSQDPGIGAGALRRTIGWPPDSLRSSALRTSARPSHRLRCKRMRRQGLALRVTRRRCRSHDASPNPSFCHARVVHLIGQERRATSNGTVGRSATA